MFLQKAVRVTTLMKRLRASEQGDTGASGLAAGATGGPADPNMPGGTVAGPAGGGSLLAASIKTALSEKATDAQITSVPSLPQPPAAQPEQQQQARCNGDVPQMLPQRKGYWVEDTHESRTLGNKHICSPAYRFGIRIPDPYCLFPLFDPRLLYFPSCISQFCLLYWFKSVR